LGVSSPPAAPAAPKAGPAPSPLPDSPAEPLCEAPTPPTAHPHTRCEPAVIVSCDVVGHSREKEFATQCQQLQGINDLVRAMVVARASGQLAWPSRGDGGHVVLSMPTPDDWRDAVLKLIRDLRAWSDRTHTPLRIVAHKGEVARFVGADGRAEFVGDDVNFV